MFDMDINQKINEIALQYFDGNNVKFAALMSTNEANIRNYRKSVVPKLDFLIKLNEKLEISFDWLLIDEGEMKRQQDRLELQDPIMEYGLTLDEKRLRQTIPLYSFEAAAGLTKLFGDKPNILNYITIPNLPKCDGAVHITGDSMYPLLKSGDIVIYKRINDVLNGIFWGEMYLLSVSIDDEDLTMVKFIQKSDLGNDYIKLVSQNQHHAPKDVLLKNISAIAAIKASIRINSMT
jgi:phage repressor protein C with HTH and peptisase S24 domain